MVRPPTFSLCIPYHPDGGWRDRLFAWTRARWEAQYPDAELIVAGDDTGAVLLNRSRMRNNCARLATTDTLIFADADWYAPPGALHDLCDLLPRAGIVQFERLDWVQSPQAAESVLAQDPATPAPTITGQVDHWTGMYGLCFGMTRQTLDTVGGWDERFQGWGEEDPAFLAAVATLVGPKLTIDATATHLWHPRGAEHDETSASFRRNRALGQRYSRARGNIPAMLQVLGLPDTWMDGRPTPRVRRFRCTRQVGFADTWSGEQLIVRAGYVGTLPEWTQAQTWFQRCLRSGVLVEVE